MTKSQEWNGIPPVLADERALAWMDEHRTDLSRSLAGRRIQNVSLIMSFVVGLAAHIGGYTLLSSAPRWPLGLLADLLHALGWSLWTGVVVVLFVEVIPEAKRQQIEQAMAAYEALRSDTAEDSEPRRRPASGHVRGRREGRGQIAKRARGRARKVA